MGVDGYIVKITVGPLCYVIVFLLKLFLKIILYFCSKPFCYFGVQLIQFIHFNGIGRIHLEAGVVIQDIGGDILFSDHYVQCLNWAVYIGVSPVTQSQRLESLVFTGTSAV